ncbi:MAG: hypothetical protein QOF58_6553 [Pseudonocardiales bacterium]|jgi:hypothetical protein|nr:hypothetical protein [Pseudonocardiales bacterium]
MAATGNVMTPETFAARLLPIYATALAGADFWRAEVADEVRATRTLLMRWKP